MRNKKIFIILFIISGLLLSNFMFEHKTYSNSSIANTNSLEFKRKVLRETMDAFYRKGNKIQYDSYRKVYSLVPETITDDNNEYSVCSAFVQSVYKNAFNINVLTTTSYMGRYAYINSKNEHYEYAPFSYYKNNGYYLNGVHKNEELGLSDFEKILNKLLLPGDIIIVNTESPVSGGHVMLVYGVDKASNELMFIHSTGDERKSIDDLKTAFDELGKNEFQNKYKNSYINFDNIADEEYFEINGAIRKNKFSTYFNNKYDKYNYIGIIRPLGKTGEKFYEADTPLKNPSYDKTTKVPTEDFKGYEYKKLELTPNGKMRGLYSNIEVTKLGSHHNNSNVNLNDTITYTIKIQNKSDVDYQGISVKETLSNYVDLVKINNNGKKQNNEIIWNNLIIKKNSELKISYSVIVKNDKQNYGKKIISKGVVYNQEANLLTTTITNIINKTLSDSQINNLENNIEKLINNHKNIQNGLDFVNEVYKQTFKYDLKIKGLKQDDFVEKNQKINNNDYVLSVKSEYNKLILNDFVNSSDRNAFYRTKRSSAIDLNAVEDNYNDVSNKYMKKLHYNNLKPGDFIYTEGYGLDINDNKAVKRFYYTTYLCLKDKYLKLETYVENNQNVFSIKEIRDKKIINRLINSLFRKNIYFVFSPGQLIGEEKIIEKKVISISINKLPNKIRYLHNSEKLNLDGGELNVNYNDGTKEIVLLTNKNVLVSGFDNSKIGNNTIIVNYDDFTTNFVISVVDNNIVNNNNNINSSNDKDKDKDKDKESNTTNNIVNKSYSYMYIVLIVIGILVVFSVLFVDNKK